MMSNHHYPSALSAKDERVPPSWSSTHVGAMFEMQGKPSEKSPWSSSIDAEIDSLTCMLADMENSSSYQRGRQNFDYTSAATSQSATEPTKAGAGYKASYTGQSGYSPSQSAGYSSTQHPAYTSASQSAAYNSQSTTYSSSSQPTAYSGQTMAYNNSSQVGMYSGSSQPQNYSSSTQQPGLYCSAPQQNYGSCSQQQQQQHGPYGGTSQSQNFSASSHPSGPFTGVSQPQNYNSSSQPAAYSGTSQPAVYSLSSQRATYGPPSPPSSYPSGQPGGYNSSQHPVYNLSHGQKPYPQPVPASYTTATTSTGPAFNVQVKVAQPVSNYTQPRRKAEQAYGPPSPRQQVPSYGQQHNMGMEPPGESTYRAVAKYPEPAYGLAPHHSEATPLQQKWYQQSHHPSGPASKQLDSSPGVSESEQDRNYGQPGARRAESDYYGPGPSASRQYTSSSGMKGTEFYSATVPPAGSGAGSRGYGIKSPPSKAEDELDRLTKKLVYDMNNPPSGGEYFGRCARCGESVVGDGTGCIAMDQVFHVECFTCVTCHCRLRGQPFYAIDKKSYCESCYIVTLEKCSACAKPIMDRILRAMGKAYHPQCFTCVACHRCLDGVPFTVDASSQIHCIEDFHRSVGCCFHQKERGVDVTLWMDIFCARIAVPDVSRISRPKSRQTAESLHKGDE
ncbi:lipoma-preferred partner homolog isoform X2 [Protopterus annectens]|uniref:lipoma-preferred partner homolog isoform X2 n=1 Tax=Protopterus annectens TaxID=7888 RepID=UPI001CFB3148|nr:lipoma-preferred partner homolog isoform X2 [Protopterus annectens]